MRYHILSVFYTSQNDIFSIFLVPFEFFSPLGTPKKLGKRSTPFKTLYDFLIPDMALGGCEGLEIYIPYHLMLLIFENMDFFDFSSLKKNKNLDNSE